MKDILYFNTLEDIKLVKAMRVKKGDFTRYKTNGHAYVDLGLPSGTLWATMNVGAQSETDHGLYFAWGETQGYSVQFVHGDKEDYYTVVDRTFDENSYQYGQLLPVHAGEQMQLQFTVTKYNGNDEKTILDLEDDAAHVNMGGDWHIPSPAQFEELLDTDYVTNEFVENYNSSGISGLLFTSVADSTKKLFMPYNGDINQNMSDLDAVQIWSNKVSDNGPIDADLLYANSDKGTSIAIDHYYRYYGLGVRGVIGQTTQNAPGTSYGNDDPVNTDPSNSDPSSPFAPKPGVGEEIAGGKN